MAERAKQDVESGAVAQSIVDSRGPTSSNRLYLLLEESYPVRHVGGQQIHLDGVVVSPSPSLVCARYLYRLSTQVKCKVVNIDIQFRFSMLYTVSPFQFLHGLVTLCLLHVHSLVLSLLHVRSPLPCVRSPSGQSLHLFQFLLEDFSMPVTFFRLQKGAQAVGLIFLQKVRALLSTPGDPQPPTTGSFLNIFGGNFFSYYIQHCFICRPSDSTVPTADAEIEPRTVATGALAVRRSKHQARSQQQVIQVTFYRTLEGGEQAVELIFLQKQVLF